MTLADRILAITPDAPDVEAVHEVIERLDRGQLRVAERVDGNWVVNAWVKTAILHYFRTQGLQTTSAGPLVWHDKIPTKADPAGQGIRIVPPGVVRYGAFLERGCVVMPGYVNIGAWVGAGTLVDTWATVGSCAQIGRNVHLSGGVGIGGVLEPASARPVIVEDGVFIGSRCVVVEGVIVGERAVLGAGVTLTASTQIVDVTGAEEVVMRGVVPPYSVVIPGMRARVFPAGTYQVPCALVIGQRSERTDLKTSLESALRDFSVAV